jgi:hypothetical protein
MNLTEVSPVKLAIGLFKGAEKGPMAAGIVHPVVPERMTGGMAVLTEINRNNAEKFADRGYVLDVHSAGELTDEKGKYKPFNERGRRQWMRQQGDWKSLYFVDDMADILATAKEPGQDAAGFGNTYKMDKFASNQLLRRGFIFKHGSVENVKKLEELSTFFEPGYEHLEISTVDHIVDARFKSTQGPEQIAVWLEKAKGAEDIAAQNELVKQYEELGFKKVLDKGRWSRKERKGSSMCLLVNKTDYFAHGGNSLRNLARMTGVMASANTMADSAEFTVNELTVSDVSPVNPEIEVAGIQADTSAAPSETPANPVAV